MRSKSISLLVTLMLGHIWLAAQEFEGVSRAKPVKLVPPGYEESAAPAPEPEVVYPTSDVDIDIPAL